MGNNYLCTIILSQKLKYIALGEAEDNNNYYNKVAGVTTYSCTSDTNI